MNQGDYKGSGFPELVEKAVVANQKLADSRV